VLRISVIFVSFVVIINGITFAQASELTEITVTIIGEPIIEVEENFLIRANVEIENYDPGDGYYFLKIINNANGNVLTDSEIQPHYKGNDIWSIQVAYMTQENDLEVGEYEIIIVTEFGTATASTILSVVETITQTEQEEADEEIILQTEQEEADEEIILQSEQEEIIEDETAIQGVSAVTFRDSSGYLPSWAENSGYHSVLNKCNGLIGDYSSDGNWCFEWVAYVLDQGIENFPSSTTGTSKPFVESSFPLEDGPLYSGELTNFFPDSFTFGDDWLVGKPFTSNSLDALREGVGLTDMASQRLLIPDTYDNSANLKISYIIMKFDSASKIKPYFEKMENEFKDMDLPNVGEYFELLDKGITPNSLLLEKSDRFFVADCIGVLNNIEKKNEEARLACIKDEFLVITQGASNKFFVENNYILSTSPESVVYDYSEKIFNNIDNQLHSNLKVNFPDEAQFIAFQYSKGEISDENFLNYFQKSINEGKIRIPTDGIVIDKNSQRLSYIPDLYSISIINWGQGLNTDSGFSDIVVMMVEKGYLTVSGLDSSSITVSTEEREEFLDMDEVDESEQTSSPSIEKEETRQEVVSESTSESDAGSMVLGALIVFGIPALIIWAIIRDRKKRKQKIPKGSTFGEKWKDDDDTSSGVTYKLD